MAVFLDTGFYMGLISKKDEHYDASVRILTKLKSGEYGQIYTSNLIMAETSTLVAARTNRNSIALIKTEQLFIGELRIATILRPDEQVEKRTWEISKRVNLHKGKKNIPLLMSFVDCSNLALCETRGIENIVSFDTHFKPWIQIIE